MKQEYYVLTNLDKTMIVYDFDVYTEEVYFISIENLSNLPEYYSDKPYYLQSYLDEHEFLYNECIISKIEVETTFNVKFIG